MARNLKAVTPFGTFERTTDADYSFVAVAEQRDHPEKGVSLAGSRKGDPELAVRREYTYHIRPYDETSELRTAVSCRYYSRYHVVWSKTAAGALKNAENYPYDAVRVLGVFPVSQ